MSRLGLALLLCVALFVTASANPKIDDWGDSNQMQQVYQGGPWTIAHVGSVVHVSVVGTSGSGQAVTQSGQWNVAHVTSQLHVRLIPSTSATDVLAVHATQTGQWNVAHIAAQLHVRLIPSTSATDVLAVHATQTGQWNVAHISGILHVRVSPSSNANDLLGTHAQVRDKNCTTCSVRVDHVGALAIQAHQSGSLRAWQVNACGGTASLAVATNTSRRDLILKNLGGAAANSDSNVIFIGFGTTGHVALTTANGFPITVHMSTAPVIATPPVVLANYQGPVACITNANTAVLSVIEILQ